MQLWEYERVENNISNLMEHINELGKDRWELVNFILKADDFKSNIFIAVLKRSYYSEDD